MLVISPVVVVFLGIVVVPSSAGHLQLLGRVIMTIVVVTFFIVVAVLMRFVDL